MRLQLIRTALPENRRITPRLRVIQRHGFLEKLKPIDFLNGIRGRLDIIKHNERLSLGFEVGFRDDVDNRAVFREELCQGLLEFLDFDALLEIADLNRIRDLVRNISWFLHGFARIRSRGENKSSHRLCGDGHSG